MNVYFKIHNVLCSNMSITISGNNNCIFPIFGIVICSKAEKSYPAVIQFQLWRRRSDSNFLEQTLIYGNKPPNLYCSVHKKYWKDSYPNILNYNKKLHSKKIIIHNVLKYFWLLFIDIILVIQAFYMIFNRAPTNSSF